MNDLTKTDQADFEEDIMPEEEAQALLLDIDGFEGPIDLLLELSRKQKVDLTQISILQLARQYLLFIEQAKELRLDIAAEYLVMAAWLAYLKSRLLLPKQEDESGEVSGEEMAEALQFQLLRLQSMQKAAEDLSKRPQLGQQIFARGMPEGLIVSKKTAYEATLYDLLKAYGGIARRKEHEVYEPVKFSLMSMEDALDRVTNMLGALPRKGPYSVWTSLQNLLPEGAKDPLYTRSALASSFTALLELTKQGHVELKQDGLFRPIYLRQSKGSDIEKT